MSNQPVQLLYFNFNNMKRLLLVLLSSFITLLGYSQGNADFDKLNVRTNFGPPIQDTIAAPFKIGEMRTRPQDNLWYRYNGNSSGQKWDFIYFGPSNSIVSTLDQVLNRGNLSSLGIQVGPSIFTSLKVPSLGVTGQILMVTVGPDGTFSAQTVPGGGSTISSINALTASAQFLATSFSVATSPKFLSVTATHTLNLPIANALDTGIVTPAQVALWNGKSNLPGSGTSLQYLAGDSTWHTFPIIPAAGNFATAGGGIAITGVWPNLLFTVSGGGGGGITALTSDVVATGTGAIAATIQPNVVSYAKMQQAGSLKILGNSTGSTANIQEVGVASGIIFNSGSLKSDTTLLLTVSKGTTFVKYADTAAMLSVYYRKPGGTTLQYIRGDGSLATTDTTMIPNFFLKIRSELTPDAPVLYSTTTGHIGVDTSTGNAKLATQGQLLNFVTVTRFLDSLLNADTIQTLRPVFVKHGVKDTISVKNDSAAWNAKSLLGVALGTTPPTDGQALAYQLSSNTWIPMTIAGGGSTLTFSSSLINTSGTVTLVNDNLSPGNSFVYGTSASGTKGWLSFSSQPVATLTTAGLMSPAQLARLDSTLSMANTHVSGADTMTYSIISHNPAITDSLYFRSLKLVGGNGITMLDSSLPQVVYKYFLLDTSSSVAHALTQGQASNLYQLKSTVPNIYSIDGTLAAARTISGNNNTLTLGTLGSPIDLISATLNKGFGLTSAQYNGSSGSSFDIKSSTINNPVTAASGTVNNWANLFVGTPNITSTNTSVVYTTPATLLIQGPPVMSTNSSAVAVYSLRVASGNSIFGGAISIVDGTQAVNRLLGSDASGNASWKTAPIIVASNDLSFTASSTTPVTVTNFTPLATGTFRIGGYLNMIGNSTLSTNAVTVTWHDENNVAQSVVILSGARNTTQFFTIPDVTIRAGTGSAIVVTETITSGVGPETYDVGATIEQLR